LGVTHHRKLLIQMAAMLVALPVLYILSSGPVLCFASDGRISRDAAKAIYAPLLSGSSVPYERAYLDLWDVHPIHLVTGGNQWLVLLPENS
jgi:hypothetical protein